MKELLKHPDIDTAGVWSSLVRLVTRDGFTVAQAARAAVRQQDGFSDDADEAE